MKYTFFTMGLLCLVSIAVRAQTGDAVRSAFTYAADAFNRGKVEDAGIFHAAAIASCGGKLDEDLYWCIHTLLGASHLGNEEQYPTLSCADQVYEKHCYACNTHAGSSAQAYCLRVATEVNRMPAEIPAGAPLLRYAADLFGQGHYAYERAQMFHYLAILSCVGLTGPAL